MSRTIRIDDATFEGLQALAVDNLRDTPNKVILRLLLGTPTCCIHKTFGRPIMANENAKHLTVADVRAALYNAPDDARCVLFSHTLDVDNVQDFPILSIEYPGGWQYPVLDGVPPIVNICFVLDDSGDTPLGDTPLADQALALFQGMTSEEKEVFIGAIRTPG